MAYFDACWYCNSVGYAAVAPWGAGATIAAGALRRQLAAPSVGNERVFVAIVGGTTGGAEPAWVLTRGAKTTDNTVTWMECTGISAVNGDKTNTPTWAQVKAAGTPSLGVIIQRNSGTSYQICTTAGTLGAAEPAFSDTAGVTTTETSATTVWTSLGVIGNFTGGQAPHARLANACASSWFVSGNTIYVGDNHAETQASGITIAPTQSAPQNVASILCHNHSGSYPPTSLTTGASLTATASSNVTFSPSAGTLYIFGLTFSGSYIILTPSNCFLHLDNCLLKATGSFTFIQVGSSLAAVVTWDNTTVFFGATSDYIATENVGFIWRNTGPILATGSAVPTGLMGSDANSRFNDIVLEALDLSQLTGNLLNQPIPYQSGNWLVKDCKLNASMGVATPGATGQLIQLVRSDSGATAYKSARYAYEGTETTETSITRVGGAADPTGQAQSRKIVTTANTQWLRPFKAEPYAIWNPVTAANVTVTVCGTINAGALPNNDDIWLEVEYLGSASFPLGTLVNTTKSNVLATNAAVASDGSTWNGGGSGAGWLPFKLVATLSSPHPGFAGYIEARVRAAKPSITCYIDPKIVLS